MKHPTLRFEFSNFENSKIPWDRVPDFISLRDSPAKLSPVIPRPSNLGISLSFSELFSSWPWWGIWIQIWPWRIFYAQQILANMQIPFLAVSQSACKLKEYLLKCSTLKYFDLLKCLIKFIFFNCKTDLEVLMEILFRTKFQTLCGYQKKFSQYLVNVQFLTIKATDQNLTL